jgi:L-threonylcarbamoyladenylate synthase
MTGTDLNYAAALLRKGELVAIPTETVYGLAGNAFSDRAVARIFEVKNRPSFDPLIVHTSNVERLSELVAEMPDEALQLARRFMPGPLTLLLPKKAVIPDLVTAGLIIVGVRIPSHPLALDLLGRLDFPLAAPSANPFGYISPTTAGHVEMQLGDKIPYILDGGPCQVGVESTIIGFPGGRPTVFRKGGVAVEAVEAVIGKVDVRVFSSSDPQAPGMLKSHYAPRIPLILGDIDLLLQEHQGKKLGIISFRKSYEQVPPHNQVVLSPSGDLTEAAQRLFAGMRELDSQDLDLILAELLPEKDLGRAINDRLRRAGVMG